MKVREFLREFRAALACETLPDPDRHTRIAEIKARVAAATPGPWEIASHSHDQAGCRCMSCEVTTGCRLDHATWPCCDETPEMIEATERAHRAGKVQESCLVAPMPYPDAVLAAHAVEDLRFLLAMLEQRGER